LSTQGFRIIPPIRILIIRQRGIGDTILSSPVFRSIRAHFKGAWISLVLDAPSVELFTRDPAVDEIVELKRSPIGILKVFMRVHGRFTIAIDLISTPFSLLLSIVSGAKTRIGWSKPGRRRARFYTHTVDISRSISAIDANLRALCPLNIEPIEKEVGIVLSEEERRRAKNRWWNELSLDNNRLTIAIHPGSLFETKQWPAERFAKLAEKLVSKGFQVVVTGSKAERCTVRKVVDSAACDLRRIPPVPIREFGCFLSNVDILICNDCGVLHLAQAVGTKTVAIFGSTDPLIWFPYESHRQGAYLYAGVQCSPCAKKVCDSLKCLKNIAVEDVIAKAVKVAQGIERCAGCFT
jgi:ADP-heptose:LPS heptosyltransferase